MFNRRTYAVFTLTLFMACLFLTAGCGGKAVAPDPEVVKKDLLGKVWQCESMFDRDVVGDAPLTLEFLADGTLKGSGGCNTFTGRYDIAAASMTFGPLAATKKACGPAVGEQEYTFMTFLAQIKSFAVDGDELELFIADSTKPMLFTSGGGGFLW